MKKARAFLKTLGSCRARRSSNLLTLDRIEDLSNRYSYNPTLQWSPQVHDYFVKAYGSDHFSRISRALTRPSCYSCVRVNTLRSTSDDVIEKLQAVIMNKSGSENDVDSKRCSSEARNIRDLECSGHITMGQTENKANPLKACFQSPSVSKYQIPGLDYVVFVRGSEMEKMQR